MDEAVTRILDHLDRLNPGGALGVYLYGSGASSGLKPDSDIDLLLLTRESLDATERRALTALLLQVSGWRGHSERFPETTDRRPIELTSVVVDDDQSWRSRPRHDFQYGEWRRADFVAGQVPEPSDDVDVIILMATAQSAHRVLRGDALERVVAPVPPELLRAAVLDTIPDVLDGVEGDERNTLLNLARMVSTAATGEIVSKDAAAETLAPTLEPHERELLDRARAGYLGTQSDDWTGLTSQVIELSRTLATRARTYCPNRSVD